MKLTQRKGTSLNTYEIGNSSLKVKEGVLKKQTEEILFENILIKDMYELKFHDRSAIGYVGFCIAFFVFFAVEHIFNPEFVRVPFIIVVILTVLSIVNYLNAPMKLYIPTKDKGMIRLYKSRPSRKQVEEFIYVLEGKVNLAAKKQAPKEDLSIFLKSGQG